MGLKIRYDVEVRPKGHRHPRAMTASPFQVGQVYYGTLACAHGSFPVICVKRTEKSVWFEHSTQPDCYPQKRSRVRNFRTNGVEYASFHGWHISSDSVKDNGWDTTMA